MAAFGFFRLGRLLLAVAATPLAGPVLGKAPDLPQTAPVPQLNQQVTPPPPTEIPVPEPRPEDAPEPPAIAPQPPEKPARAEPPAGPPGAPPNPAEADEKAEQKILPDPRSAAIAGREMPAEELACRRRLKSMGVDFEERKPEHDTSVGCSIPYPIALKTLGKSIAIGPEPELNCQMAEAAARFAASVIQPAAKAEFGADIKSIGQASAFVCRSRNGGGKLSEHAFGNALDIASFKLSDGKEIDVGPVPPEKDAKFLNAVRKAACGPFKTVLGPGSDADHSQHLHFDLEPRRNGGTFCQ
ncbi:extensin family protein [Mesorhizobium sp. M0184]|uniref:extensin-like domain-containing protein n=1 Tax=Mesorhizobium sp. M0184 TaxID=2956906 RepID=UPI00333D98AE